MLQPAVTEIIGKTQKKQYDQLDTPKVIGYFEKSTRGVRDMPLLSSIVFESFSMYLLFQLVYVIFLQIFLIIRLFCSGLCNLCIAMITCLLWHISRTIFGLEYDNFVKAAETFQPLITFFATFDKKVRVVLLCRMTS